MGTIYFSPVKIEYPRDLMREAMGRSTAAAHSFYDLAGNLEAAGYLDYDNDIPVIEQAIEHLSALFRRHYDFLNSVSHQYNRAEKQNISFLEKEVIPFQNSLYTEDIILNHNWPTAVALTSVLPLILTEGWEGELTRADLSEFLSVPMPTMSLSEENSITARPVVPMSTISLSEENNITARPAVEKFVALQALDFIQDGTNSANTINIGLAVIEPLVLPLIDSQSVEPPVKSMFQELSDFSGFGFFADTIVPWSTEWEPPDEFGDWIRRINDLADISVPIPSKLNLEFTKTDLSNKYSELLTSVTLPLSRVKQDVAGILSRNNSIPESGAAEGDLFTYVKDMKNKLGDLSFTVPLVRDLQRLFVSLPPDAASTVEMPAAIGFQNMEKSVSYENKEVNDGRAHSIEIPSMNGISGVKLGLGEGLLAFRPGFSSINDFFAYLERLEFLFDAVGITKVSVASVEPLSALLPAYTFYHIDNAKNGDNGLQYQVLDRNADQRNTLQSQGSGFKSIVDFFIYLERIKYLFDTLGIPKPSVTSLEHLTISKSDYTFCDVIVLERLAGGFHYLEKILYRKNKVTIKEVKIGEFLDFDGMVLPDYASANYLDAENVDMLMDRYMDGKPVDKGQTMQSDNVLYVLDLQHETEEDIYEVVIEPFQKISAFARDNFDEDIVLPVAKVGSYLDVDEVEKRPPVAYVFPGIRVTDEMDLTPLLTENHQGAVIHQPERLEAQTLNSITIIHDDGSLLEVPQLDVMPYQTMEGLSKGSEGNWGIDYLSVSKLDDTSDNEVMGQHVSVGAFASALPPEQEQDQELVYIPGRAPGIYMDVESLELDRKYGIIPSMAIKDYEHIEAANILEEVKNILQSGSADKYAAKYEDGIAGMARDTIHALAGRNASTEEIDNFVQDVERLALAGVRANYMQTQNPPDDDKPEGWKDEGVVTHINPPKPNEPENLAKIYPLPGSVFAGDDVTINEFNALDGVRIHILPSTRAIAAGGDVALNRYERDKPHIYAQVETAIDAKVKDGEATHIYRTDAEGGDDLLNYKRDDDDSVIRNESEGLITNVSVKDEAEVEISITKRLELWLKWLYEMSMTAYSKKKDHDFFNAIGNLKKMVIDEPIFSDVTWKSIKRISEDQFLVSLLKNGIDAEQIVADNDSKMSGL